MVGMSAKYKMPFYISSKRNRHAKGQVTSHITIWHSTICLSSSSSLSKLMIFRFLPKLLILFWGLRTFFWPWKITNLFSDPAKVTNLFVFFSPWKTTNLFLSLEIRQRRDEDWQVVVTAPLMSLIYKVVQKLFVIFVSNNFYIGRHMDRETATTKALNPSVQEG